MRRAFFKQHLPHSSPVASQDQDQVGDNIFGPSSQQCSLSMKGLHHPPTHTHTMVQARQQRWEAAKKAHPHTDTPQDRGTAEQEEVSGEVSF